MAIPEIFIEHRRDEKVQKYLRVKPGRDLFVIGSSASADLRLGGEGVMGCHAVLRYRNNDWFVCDVSGQENLKVDGQVVTEARVDESTRVEINGHRVLLFRKEQKTDLFTESGRDQVASGRLDLHQVVVRSRGRIIETKVLRARDAFVTFDGEKKMKLPAPQNGLWQETRVGARTVQQRLVTAQEMAAGEKLEFDRDLRKPMIIAFLFLCTLVGLITIANHQTSKHPEVALDQKSMDMIFNAKTIKKKKIDAQKVVKAAKGRSGGTTEAVHENVKATQPEESTAPRQSAQASTAMTSLRKSGLSNLIGKIAKRANQQGNLVAAVGVSADQPAGRALFSHGTSTVGGGGSAAKEGPTFKLGGIATTGKKGGVGNFREGTALAGGTVGAGNVLALSDDEETSIEGGLDRDAIADVIKRNIGQIRYCYERQLSSNPDLYGKVLVRFVIGAEGIVSEQKVDATTLKSSMVEGCILRRLAGWKFPLPKGGTQVRVSYPFLFKALDKS